MRFFLRNSPETVNNAVTLTEDDFVKEYSGTTASEENLRKAYKEIRKAKNLPISAEPTKPLPQRKEVKFKVVQTDKKVLPITTPVKKKVERELSHEEEQEELMLEAANAVQMGSMLQEGELPDPSKFSKVEPISLNNIKENIADALKAKPIGEGAPEGTVFTHVQTLFDPEPIPLDKPIIVGKGTAEDPVTVKPIRGRKRGDQADKRDARILELLKEGKKGTEIIPILAEEGYKAFPAQITAIKKANNL